MQGQAPTVDRHAARPSCPRAGRAEPPSRCRSRSPTKGDGGRARLPVPPPAPSRGAALRARSRGRRAGAVARGCSASSIRTFRSRRCYARTPRCKLVRARHPARRHAHRLHPRRGRRRAGGAAPGRLRGDAAHRRGAGARAARRYRRDRRRRARLQRQPAPGRLPRAAHGLRRRRAARWSCSTTRRTAIAPVPAQIGPVSVRDLAATASPTRTPR